MPLPLPFPAHLTRGLGRKGRRVSCAGLTEDRQVGNLPPPEKTTAKRSVVSGLGGEASRLAHNQKEVSSILTAPT